MILNHSGRERAKAILEHLAAAYPEADCTLQHASPWELMVGAILAAQCTDARVNQVTPILFSKFPDIQSAARAEIADIEPVIRSCGLYHNKAKAIKGSAEMLMTRFGGVVPRTRGELLELPGIGRKIANLVLGDAFGRQEIVVDTHAKRLARLMGFTESDNPDVVERDLLKVVPEDARARWGHLMVTHGRAVCRAQCRKCFDCCVREWCAYGSALPADKGSAGDCV